MSYVVLARKYRPKSFATLVGQEHVVKALTHALTVKRLHHAYLFTGTRGVGKTTIARILAKALNCEVGVSATPCGVCAACVAIDAGRFIDYIEMDAASNRSVDEMTQILESAPYKLDSTRYKVLMIDEVHMLTNHAFNAMLKTLEEPPEHVKFILATTDPQKIPVTVLSRCLQFNLKQMPQPQIVGHLEEVLKAENIEAERQGLRLIAAAASGSMRDALSLTDQAIAYSAGEVTEEAIRGMLGAIDMSYLIRILDALVAGDAAVLLAVADEMLGRSLSFGGALAELASLLSRIAVAQAAPAAIADDAPEREDILRLAQAFRPEEVQLHYQIAIHGKNDLPQAPDEVTGFTMTLLRMLAFRPDEGGGVRAESSAPRAAVPTARAAVASAPAPAARPAPTPVAQANAPERASAQPAAELAATGSFDGDWPALIARLPLTGFVRTWANKSEFKSLNGGAFDLCVGTQKLADDKPMQEKLRTAIELYLGKPVRLNVTVGELAGASVAAITEKHNDERQRAAEASIMGDPFVKEMMEKVGTRPTNVRPV
ncbi:MAG TPA: DNA polymerase III subunit gamma/tau [Burkholderiales bacterium]|jgi:DNA polymerase-3 subunit gamma/tau|nr:DNA polymerase III subunit gamma/tau [Burkholderiales bacterium]